jgi:phosphoenolpyruvate synthase/pyruvate phosphate dikinase
MASYVRSLDDVSDSDSALVGGKATNLAILIQANLPIPKGIAVGLTAFGDSGMLNEDAKKQITLFLDTNKLYAVRSSALAEDAEGASWAGQFETFLDTKPEDVLAKIELCHNSTKSRAIAYSEDKASEGFDIAVVVQEMLKPEYAGVLFTKDPLTGEDELVTEYVVGLGEELVSGRADPKRIVLSNDEAHQAPFNTTQLAELAIKAEQLFGVPQDIEWVWAGGQIWLVQARPITITQESREGYYLGEPSDLFYWGPSRATPIYMSDFMAAAERMFILMANDTNLPTPPKTLVLFDEGKMVWLSNAQAFADFTEQTFIAYEKRNQLDEDIKNWEETSQELDRLSGTELNSKLVDAWFYTEFAEFSLYGAETNLIKRLSRFDSETRQDIWGAFTVPDKPSFLIRIDFELAQSQDPSEMAKKYSWIQNGYEGLSENAEQYFTERLKVIAQESHEAPNYEDKRKELTEKLGLTDDEINALTLARRLAEFMDNRKAWMMKTRQLLTSSVSDIEHGWYFNDGKVSKISEDDTHELWQRYVDFKASTSAVIGVVASNGGKHFINGEVVIVATPTDVVADGKIVVVPSTSPSYVPLMRKAKALVTDHGGMMSHAAIVAREFNLPCIVGTKQATKVLKTGDKVVLDLVKGEVNR